MADIIEVAHHEAGHAVAAFVLNLGIGRKGVTIVSDAESLGAAYVLHQLRENSEIEISPRTHVRILDYAVMCLAGDAAQKKFNPRRRYGGQNDLHNAADLLSYISGSNKILELQLKIARLRACGLVEVRWKQIEAVAAALVERKTLNREEVRQACHSTTMLLITGGGGREVCPARGPAS
jgi:ATP-dependent Zn protease